MCSLCSLRLPVFSVPLILLVVFVSPLSLAPLAEGFAPQSNTLFQSSPPETTTTTTALMGIKGFRSWFESQFPTAMVALPKDGVSEEFDHVLIDMNQLLHICVRKSRSDGHALTLLMKELDGLLQKLATPTQSLVLAMDGPPSAAKVATQRKRRRAVWQKTDWKLKHMKRWHGRGSPKKLAWKKRRAASDLRTLCLTPGTDFMRLAEQAMLYWAWQRLSSQTTVLSQWNVKIFLSPSTVPGEGEVKLLEWIYSKPRRGESIAILGGDSDLVLEGLVIPPASTHNVFVLLPDGSKRYLCVGLWETTRTLDRFFASNLLEQPENLMRVRTDLVVLLILNGNDYLPKLRGSSGFNKLFHSYLRLHREWNKKGKSSEAFLVDPDTLEFNLSFGIAYFRQLAAMAPPESVFRKRKETAGASDEDRASSLAQLNNLVEAGFLPKPCQFMVINDVDDDSEEEEEEEEDDEEEALSESEQDEAALVGAVSGENEGEKEDTMLVRLTLGKPDTDDFYVYEILHPVGEALKSARHELSKMALEELLGYDSDDEESDEETARGQSSGYDWEIRHIAPCQTDSYLYGLLWNLQTYQDGVCSDYAYNYGKRHSPTARNIVDFFKKAQVENRKLGPKELGGDSFSAPVSAGISCLAALPSMVNNLIPEPYSAIPDATVEDIYGSCMDPEDNTFDIKKFERRCDELVDEMNSPGVNGDLIEVVPHDERRIMMSDHYWTVISKVQAPLTHPFEPPLPFSERLSKLRPNNRIRVSRFMATKEPRPRSQNKSMSKPRRNGFVKNDPTEAIEHSDPGFFIAKHGSIEDVPYKIAYKKQQGPKKPKKAKMKMPADASVAVTKKKHSKTEKKKKPKPEIDIAARMRAFKVEQPPLEPDKTVDGLTAMALLKQLEDAGMIGPMEWSETTPSKSLYAVFDPKGHESIGLFVHKGTDPENSILLEDLSYEQDREINSVSKKAIRHHLASLALCDITGPRAKWSELTFNDLKEFLLDSKKLSKAGKKS